MLRYRSSRSDFVLERSGGVGAIMRGTFPLHLKVTLSSAPRITRCFHSSRAYASMSAHYQVMNETQLVRSAPVQSNFRKARRDLHHVALTLKI
jgi:hypothetical protein